MMPATRAVASHSGCNRLSQQVFLSANQTLEKRMREASWFPVVKVLSWLVLLLMLAAAAYTFTIIVTHWSGIGV